MKNRRIFVAILCAVIVLCAGLHASARDEWISVRSKNFHLIGNASEKNIRLVATKLEQFRESFRLLFPKMRMTSPIQTNVVVFKNSSSYRPYKPKRADGKTDDWLAGYFQSGEDVNYITLSTEGDREDTYGTIFHEYVHYLLDTNFGKTQIPPWFNEGLAEYYQTYKIVEDQKITLGIVQGSHLDLLQQTRLMPLKQLFEVNQYSLNATGNHSRSIFYAQAWALVHFLIQGNGGANLQNFERFLSLVLKDVEPETAFKQAFNSDYATMEKALKKYVDQGKYTATMYPLKQKLIFDAEMIVSPITEAQASAYLGDLLYHTREYAAAETHLQKALSLDANLSMAHTSLGLVKMRQRNFAEAKKYLERAIADDQKNHFAHYNYAYVLSRESTDEFGYVSKYPAEAVMKMRESLLKAIEINPEFSESYRLLAFIGMISGANLDEALTAVKKGLALQPGNQDYLLLAAKIFLRQEKYDNAKAIADKVAKTADKQDVRSEAESLLGSIKQIADAKAAYESQVAEMRIRGMRQPTIVPRSALTDAEVERLDRERDIRNMNRMVGRLEAGEERVVGRIEKIACAGGEVKYAIRTADKSLTLTSKDFQSINMDVFKEGTHNLEVGCDAKLQSELAVITYRPTLPAKSGVNGALTSLAFVPDHFKLLKEEELIEMNPVIIQGGPPTDTVKNAEIAASELADFEKLRRESMMKQIQQALREPLAGEVRVLGTVDKIECSGRDAIFHIGAGGQILKLKAPPSGELKITVFTPDLGGVQLGCGSSVPGAKAVITYLPSTDKKPKIAGGLKAVEFVPATFVLS